MWKQGLERQEKDGRREIKRDGRQDHPFAVLTVVRAVFGPATPVAMRTSAPWYARAPARSLDPPCRRSLVHPRGPGASVEFPFLETRVSICSAWVRSMLLRLTLMGGCGHSHSQAEPQLLTYHTYGTRELRVGMPLCWMFCLQL
jgi:hypothetical protein